eukprot:301506_1
MDFVIYTTPVVVESVNAVADWSMYISITYGIFWLAAVIFISIDVYEKKQDPNMGFKAYVTEIWRLKSVYIPLIAHIFDSATDIGVSVHWAQLAFDHTNYENINMVVHFGWSIGIIGSHRTVSAYFAYSHTRDTHTHIQRLFYAFLAFIDLYIFRIAYHSIQIGKPSNEQIKFRALEAVFESIPQIVFQSVFIIKCYGNSMLSSNLVMVSILASVLNVALKLIKNDQKFFAEKAKQIQFKCEKPCCNLEWVKRAFWRGANVSASIFLFSLVWTNIGGFYLGVTLSISFILWFATDLKEYYLMKQKIYEPWRLITVVARCVYTPASSQKIHIGIHMIEVFVGLLVTTVFGFTNIDCKFCSDPQTRQATHNPYIKSFICVAWGMMIFDGIFYLILICDNIFDEQRFNSRQGINYRASHSRVAADESTPQPSTPQPSTPQPSTPIPVTPNEPEVVVKVVKFSQEKPKITSKLSPSLLAPPTQEEICGSS